MVHHDKSKGFPERSDCCGQGHDKGSQIKWIYFVTFFWCPIISVVLESLSPVASKVHSASLSCHQRCAWGGQIVGRPSSKGDFAVLLCHFSGVHWSLFQCNIAKHLTMLISSSKSWSQLECASPPERKAHPTHAHTHLPSCTHMPMPHSQALVDDVKITIYIKYCPELTHTLVSIIDAHTVIQSFSTWVSAVCWRALEIRQLEHTGHSTFSHLLKDVLREGKSNWNLEVVALVALYLQQEVVGWVQRVVYYGHHFAVSWAFLIATGAFSSHFMSQEIVCNIFECVEIFNYLTSISGTESSYS